MQEVGIYIYTTVKSPQKRCGAYAYVLEVATAKGPATCTGTELLEGATPHQAELLALAAAIKRLYKKCALKIYMDSAYVAAGAEKWMDVWKKNGWNNARGQQVSNLEEWKELDCLLDVHEFQFVVGKEHPYYQWLRSESEKAERNVRSRKHREI